MIRFIRLFKSANSLEKAWAPTQLDAPDTVFLHAPSEYGDSAQAGQYPTTMAGELWMERGPLAS